MYFLVDNNRKIIFGWSAKCGCSHVKKIFFYLTNVFHETVHLKTSYQQLPKSINGYKIILISRNPYERLVSGFLDKYNPKGSFRSKWNSKTLTFNKFVEELLKEKWTTIDKHHFTRQTSEAFKPILINNKNIRYFDIKNIDYEYIEQLYNKKLPDSVKYFKGDHSRKTFENVIEDYVYDLDIKEYYEKSINYKYFYNPALKQKVFNFYKKDFEFFHMFEYDKW